jgi:hypothetical protein
MVNSSVRVVTTGSEMRTKPVWYIQFVIVWVRAYVHKFCSYYEVLTAICNVQEDANLLEYETV